MRHCILAFTGFLFVLSALQSQDFERINFDLIVGGEAIISPFVGGLNSPQFSKADLNNDGQDDLYLFDREGNKSMTFINQGENGEIDYVYAPEFEKNFPELNNWVALRDFNMDGVMDLFAHSDFAGIQGVIAYRGLYNNEDELVFERVNFDNAFNVIDFPPLTGDPLPLFVTNIDYPAFDDVP